MNRTVLAVDIGTSSLKAALVDADGTIRASARCRFPERRRTAADWIDALAEAFARLEPGASLAAIAISGNGPSLASVDRKDRDGELLLWNDPVPEGLAYRTGGSEPASMAKGTYAHGGLRSRSLFVPRLEAFRALYPEAWTAARVILSGPEYLVWRLTGEAVTILPDPRFTPAYWDKETLGDIDPSILAPFVPTGTIVGKTGKTAGCKGSRPDGLACLPAGIPVVACGPDFVAALIGTGTLEAGRACDRAGTSEGLNFCVADAVSGPGVRTLPSVIGGLWNASILLPDTGARFHDWRRACGRDSLPYPQIMSEIEASPIEPLPGQSTHPGRALVEDIGFSVRRGIETLRRATGFSPVFTLSGGQARNGIWNRMKADITGARFALTATPDGELMGGAVTAFTALGDYPGLEAAARAMVRVTKTYEPDPVRHALYTEKYLRHEDMRHS